MATVETLNVTFDNFQERRIGKKHLLNFSEGRTLIHIQVPLSSLINT